MDAPPWQAGAAPAGDGARRRRLRLPHRVGDATSIPTGGLGQGRHTVYIRGRDASGAWGPVSAAFFWVLDPATRAEHRGRGRATRATGQPLAATVTAGPFATATDPVDGQLRCCSLPRAPTTSPRAADGHAPVHCARRSRAVPEATTPLDFRLAPYQQVLSDDVEGGNIGWTAQSPWAITDEASREPDPLVDRQPGRRLRGQPQRVADLAGRST